MAHLLSPVEHQELVEQSSEPLTELLCPFNRLETKPRAKQRRYIGGRHAAACRAPRHILDLREPREILLLIIVREVRHEPILLVPRLRDGEQLVQRYQRLHMTRIHLTHQLLDIALL